MMEELHKMFEALVSVAVPLACIISALIMVLHDKPYWGWFLAIALFTYSK